MYSMLHNETKMYQLIEVLLICSNVNDLYLTIQGPFDYVYIVSLKLPFVHEFV